MMSRSILSRAFSRRSLDTSLANSAASEPDCRALAGLAASRIQRRNKLSWMPRSLATELTDIPTWVASLTASDLNSGLNFLRNAICTISHVSFYLNKLDKSVRGNGGNPVFISYMLCQPQQAMRVLLQLKRRK